MTPQAATTGALKVAWIQNLAYHTSAADQLEYSCSAAADSAWVMLLIGVTGEASRGNLMTIAWETKRREVLVRYQTPPATNVNTVDSRLRICTSP